MNILIIGGTRFFGKYTIDALLQAGHKLTIATRGKTPDPYGDRVQRIHFDRTDAASVAQALSGRHFHVVIDKLAYCSDDIRILLDVIDCDKYIQMSSTAVYEPKRMNTRETDFDALSRPLVWCSRPDFPYPEIKRQAECALWQKYAAQPSIAVRYPFVIGEDDYTRRLLFYVEHTLQSIPMYIDNPDAQMGYIRSDEAGQFIAFLVDQDFTGPINGCSQGTISLREILDYIYRKTGCQAILDPAGDPAPYNGEPAYSINTDTAAGLGYTFTRLHDWIYDLIDYYIQQTLRRQLCSEI